MNHLETQISRFLEYLLIEKKYSNATISSYQNDLNTFSDFCNQKKKELDSISKEDLKDYLSYLNKKYQNDKTIAHHITSLRSFYKFLMIEHQLEKNPISSLELPKIKKTLPTVLSVEEIEKL